MMGRFPKHGTGGKCHRDRPLPACANTAEIGSLMLYFPIDHPHFCGAFRSNSVATIRGGKVSGGGDDGGRNEDAPSAIVSQERQRAEAATVRCDPRAGSVKRRRALPRRIA